MAYSCTFVFGRLPVVKMTQETRLIAVMRNGRTLTVTPATVSRPSGAPRSQMGPKGTPCSSSRFERKA